MLALPTRASRLTGKELSNGCQCFPFLWISISSPFSSRAVLPGAPTMPDGPGPCQAGKGHLVQISRKSNILYFFFV